MDFHFLPHHPSESLTHFSRVSHQQKQSSAFHPFIPPSLRAYSLLLHVQGRWCSTLLSAAAICSNVWGYGHASLCVCKLFTEGPGWWAKSVDHVVSGYLDSMLVSRWMTGWLLGTDDWVAGFSLHVCSTDTYGTMVFPQFAPVPYCERLHRILLQVAVIVEWMPL